MKPNHYASAKPTVVLMIKDPENPLKLVDDNGETMVFKNLSKARKHVQNFIDHTEHQYIEFVNETPVYGGGDREETSNSKCLKCNSFLRPSLKTHTVKAGGKNLEFVQYDCPVCDLGESPNASL